jgi:hypothetical protein
LKNFLIATALVVAAVATPTFAADVGVSVSIGQPGFYGRIDIGDFPYPYPRVIYRQPRVVERVYIEREPIYMRVPPGHAKNWRKHCHRYDACGERVYFVQDSWYEHEYVPYYQEYHHERRDGRWDDRREHEDDRRDEYRDDRYGDDDRGKGRGHGNNGHSKNKGHGQNR